MFAALTMCSFGFESVPENLRDVAWCGYFGADRNEILSPEVCSAYRTVCHFGSLCLLSKFGSSR